MACAQCSSIPLGLSGRFTAKATFEAAEILSQDLVASGIWKPLNTSSGFEASFSCSECGAHFHLVMPDPPAAGGLLRVSVTQQRVGELRAEHQEL
jgi:hypothetical protein